MKNIHIRTLALACTCVIGSSAFAATDYLGVVHPQLAGTPAEVATCAACHGANGTAVAPNFPNLGGQNYSYLLKTLEDFRSGKRVGQVMSSMIKTVPTAADNVNLKQLASYFSEQKLDEAKTAGAATGPIGKDQAEAGYKVYFEGDAKTKTPACVACHTVDGRGDASMAVPRLAGQNAMYLVAQLQEFASGKRETAPDHVMSKIAKRLSPQEIQDVSAYLEHMRPDLMPGGADAKTYAQYVKTNAAGSVPGIPAADLAAK